MTPRVHHVCQGDFYVAGGRDTIIHAVLGSCIAACLWDAEKGIGGMNHFLLPAAQRPDLTSARFGVHAMELLVNRLLAEGADKSRLQAKLFGGAHVIETRISVGDANAALARSFLDRESIPCVACSIGGNRGRKVRFWPATGRAQQQFLTPHEILVERPPSQPAETGSIEFF